MEFHQLRYFCAVTKTGSFTKAARQEHISQPSLSQQVIKLEDEFGTKLFTRQGKEIKLTNFGESFLPKAESILRELAAVKAEIQENREIVKGQVNLGITSSAPPLFLPQKLEDLCRSYPDIDVTVTEDATPQLLRSIQAGDIDVAVVALPVSIPSLISAELMRERLFAAIPNAHPLCHHKILEVGELSEFPFLALRDSEFSNVYANVFLRARAHPRTTFESSCYLSILAMVCAGRGVSLLPEHAITNETGCRFIQIADPKAFRGIGLVHSKRHAASRALECLIEFLSKKKVPTVPPRPGFHRRVKKPFTGLNPQS